MCTLAESSNGWQGDYKEENTMAKPEKKLIANNKKAYHEYFLEERYEAGIELHGTEVKSLRMGKCSIQGVFCPWIENGEVIHLRHAYQPL